MTSSIAVQFVNRCLDRTIRTRVNAFGISVNAYLFWQVVGITLGSLAALALARLVGLSVGLMAATIFLAVVLLLLMFNSAELFGGFFERLELFGRPFPLVLIWVGSGIYHFQIAIVSCAALFLWGAGAPVLPYLDILVVGIAIGQVNGRIGCLTVGCCHGRPHSWGARYGNEHLEAGYGNYLHGARLLPVQLFESMWLLVLATCGSTMILARSAPGTALSAYVIGYGVGRFLLEFLRADTIRLFFWGFSEAQWTALLLSGTVAGLEVAGILSFQWWHVGTVGFLFFLALGFGLLRRSIRSEEFALRHPYHFREFAEAVSWVHDLLDGGVGANNGPAGPQAVMESDTSLDVCLAGTSIETGSVCRYRYSISYRQHVMTEEAAQMLALWILQLKHPVEPYELVEAQRGVFELWVDRDGYAGAG